MRQTMLAIVLAICSAYPYPLAAEETKEVGATRGKVDADESVPDTSGGVEAGPETTRKYTYRDDVWFYIVSKTFVPYDGEFAKFRFATFEEVGAVRSSGAVWKYVDIQRIGDGSSTWGVVIGSDGKPRESESEVKVFWLFRPVPNADAFPRRAEGNMIKVAGTDQHGGGDPAPWHWRWNTAEGTPGKYVSLEAERSWFTVHAMVGGRTGVSLPTLEAFAYDEDGESAEGVDATFTFKTIQNGVESAWFEADVGFAGTPSRATWEPNTDPMYTGDILPYFPTKIIVTASVPGYGSDTLELTYSAGEWVERAPKYRGYTAASIPWLVVGTGLESTATSWIRSETVAGEVAFTTAKDSVVTVQPTSSTQAQVDTNFSAGSEKANTSGVAALNNAELSKIEIVVRQPRSVSTAAIELRRIGGEEQGQYSANSFSGAQALLRNQTVVTVEDPGEPGQLSISVAEVPTIAAVKAAIQADVANRSESILIYAIWEFEGESEGRRMQIAGKTVVLLENDTDDVLYGHEIAHALGLDHVYLLDNLMGSWGVAAGRRIEKFQVDIINP